ncbi:MAG: glycosyltransferase family 39 protein [Chloroflexi bacterium]|nr:glycosyltransferase family 39 protein [Chloroflexota bacterium]
MLSTRLIHWASIGLVLALALVLRLDSMEIVEFKLDEADTLRRAREIALGQVFPSTGQPISWGIPNGPAMSYLLAVPIRLSSNPIAAVAFHALLGVLAIIATYFVVRRFWGAGVALVAALLMASSPWIVFFDRKVWAQNLPLLTVLMLYFALEAVIHRRRWALGAFFLVFGVQVQTQILASIHGIPVLAMLAIYRQRWARNDLLLAWAPFAIVSFPYLSAILSQGPTIQAQMASHLGQPWSIDLRAAQFGLWMASGYNLEAVLGPTAPLFSPYSQWLGWATIVLGGLLAVGVAAGVRAVARDPGDRDRHLLLLLWTFGPLLPLTLHSAPIFVHYLINVYPVPLIWVGIGVESLASRRRALGWAAGAALIGVVVLQLLSVRAFYGLADSYGARGGFGIPFKYWNRLAHDVVKIAEGEEIARIAVLAEGSDPRFEAQPAALDALLGPGWAPLFLGRGGVPGILLSPSQPVLHILTSDDEDQLRGWQRWGRELFSIQVPSGPTLRIFRMAPQPSLQAHPTYHQGARLSNGVEFLGYDLSPSPLRAGQAARLTTYWGFDSVSDADRAQDYQIFTHLLDASGQLWSQRDGLSLASSEWPNGYFLVQWVDLELPPDMPADEYQIYTGMYSLLDGSRARLSGGADAVVLGPVRVGS